MPTRTVPFIVNPISASRRPGVEDLIRRMASGIGIAADIVHTVRAGHAVDLARQAADDGIELVASVGGDGTANEVANGLVRSQTALAIIPIGTGNAFARALGIPLDVAAACRLLETSQTIPIDVGRVGDRHFLSTMGVGVDAEVCRLFSGTPPGQRGFARYALLAAKALWSFDRSDVSLERDDGTVEETKPVLATVANTDQYGHGVTIAPGAIPDDGLLDLCVIDLPGTLTIALNAWRLFTGTIDRMPGYRRTRTRHVRILKGGPGGYQMDGEYLVGGERLDITVVPGALRVVVPQIEAKLPQVDRSGG